MADNPPAMVVIMTHSILLQFWKDNYNNNDNDNDQTFYLKKFVWSKKMFINKCNFWYFWLLLSAHFERLSCLPYAGFFFYSYLFMHFPSSCWPPAPGAGPPTQTSERGLGGRGPPAQRGLHPSGGGPAGGQGPGSHGAPEYQVSRHPQSLLTLKWRWLNVPVAFPSSLGLLFQAGSSRGSSQPRWPRGPHPVAGGSRGLRTERRGLPRRLPVPGGQGGPAAPPAVPPAAAVQPSAPVQHELAGGQQQVQLGGGHPHQPVQPCGQRRRRGAADRHRAVQAAAGGQWAAVRRAAAVQSGGTEHLWPAAAAAAVQP